jgi:hypothetical protein
VFFEFFVVNLLAAASAALGPSALKKPFSGVSVTQLQLSLDWFSAFGLRISGSAGLCSLSSVVFTYTIAAWTYLGLHISKGRVPSCCLADRAHKAPARRRRSQV